MSTNALPGVTRSSGSSNNTDGRAGCDDAIGDELLVSSGGVFVDSIGFEG